jgi:hypothetical protein
MVGDISEILGLILERAKGGGGGGWCSAGL